ncbi:hypothetical protein [Acidovorax sp.]|uniref:hypothetical protein n=1 Tax=Acidovorax sp. TaxID=1872122 RepID=UPI00391F32C5
MTAEEFMKAFIQALGEETFQVMHDRTPIDTGKARKGYSLKVNTDGFDVTNYEDHIVALDEGHSQQAPQGMNQLTLQEMPSIVERVLAKLPKQ